MIAIIDYVTSVFSHIVSILSVKPFPDFNVSIIQIILSGFVLKYIFMFLFGGMKEFDISTNWMNSVIVNQEISNFQRKKALRDKERENSDSGMSRKEKRLIKKSLKKFDKENDKRLGIS